MLVLLDDMKVRNKIEFLRYIRNEFDDLRSTEIDDVKDYLLQTNKEIEFIVSDFDTMEDNDFADKVLEILQDAARSNKNISITMM
jgi:hypothetical protein